MTWPPWNSNPSGSAPLAVRFSAGGSYDSDGQIVNCTWDFGDGALGRGWKTTHVFAEPGTYEVYLMVLDNRGAAGSAKTTVTVTAGVRCRLETWDRIHVAPAFATPVTASDPLPHASSSLPAREYSGVIVGA